MSRKKQETAELSAVTEEAITSAEESTDATSGAPKPRVLVYCGPSVRGAARQFTAYCGGIPQELEAFLADHPAARALLVGAEDFAETRRRLGIAGTAEALIFHAIKSEL